jgi:hypothetical protein
VTSSPGRCILPTCPYGSGPLPQNARDAGAPEDGP